jgi:hypothetical protein
MFDNLTFAVGGGMGNKRPCKDFKGEVFSRLREYSVQAVVTSRQQKSSRVVMPFPDELSAEQLIASCIGGFDKLRKDLEVRLCNPNWLSRLGTIRLVISSLNPIIW